ncbi:MAG: hypothetical protein UT36_C0004G0060 [Candidatus Peregrinibacteria bacterium GW2011_GWF2_39_17]|nr:MAG: hypothetical protein UT36_C0004G0060 [Candidatus Peregrinibacteria bacterium GW2011_GWF2_39_17]HCW32654.1 hypothetical protein [Candidatus Peregrinibacteria bacterium]
MRFFGIFITGMLLGGIVFFSLNEGFFKAADISDLAENYYEIVPLQIIKADGEIFNLQVALADESLERIKGLQGVQYFREDQGMWFVFQDQANLVFWMKDMLIPLDILFVDENQRILKIIDGAVPCFKIDPEQNNCEEYSSGQLAQYVLELNEGLAKKWGLAVGDQIKMKDFEP